MEGSCLRVLSWNVNSLQKRSTDVHAYVLSHDIDVITLQEVGVNGIGFQLTGYQSFELQANINNNTRGLITLVKNNIPCDLHTSISNDGTEFLCVKLQLKNSMLYIVNTYVHADQLDLDKFPLCIFDERCLVLGDLNARHHKLGSQGSQNKNGFVLYNILESLDNVRVLGNGEPTHIRGGRIDYALLFNMYEYRADALVVGDLLSDHFAMEVSLGMEKNSFNKRRKRYRLNERIKPDFVKRVTGIEVIKMKIIIIMMKTNFMMTCLLWLMVF